MEAKVLRPSADGVIAAADILKACCKFKSPSKKMKKLMELETHQDHIIMNHNKQGRPFCLRLARVVNLEAALMQLTGHTPEIWCTRCQRGIGPFANCVISDVARVKACTSCHYNNNGKLCSFRLKPQEKNAEDQEHLQEEADSDNASARSSPETPALHPIAAAALEASTPTRGSAVGFDRLMAGEHSGLTAGENRAVVSFLQSFVQEVVRKLDAELEQSGQPEQRPRE